MTDATDDASEGDGLGIILLVVLIDMLGFSLVIPFLTYFIQDLASGSGFEGPSIDLWVGVTFAAYSLAQFLFAPLLGALSDRLGRRPIMMFGMVSNSVFFVMFGITGNLWVALIARFLAELGTGRSLSPELRSATSAHPHRCRSEWASSVPHSDLGS